MKIHDLPLHTIELSTSRRIAWTRYFNANGYVAAIVAVIAFSNRDGEIIDWTAYMGGSDASRLEEDAIRHIAEYTGCKISQDDAHYFFPDLRDEWYRT